MRLFTPEANRSARLTYLEDLANTKFFGLFQTHLGRSLKKSNLDWHELTLMLAFYAYLRHEKEYERADRLRANFIDLFERAIQFLVREDGEMIDYWVDGFISRGLGGWIGPVSLHIQHKLDPGRAFEYET